MAKKRKVEEVNNQGLTNESPNDSSSDEEEGEEDLEKTLEPFSKEQLIDLLKTAAQNDPSLLEEIHQIADRDPSHRKIFVHGLGWETTSEKLESFFLKYGEIEDCNVVMDKATGKSKGYGFLLFKHRKSAQKALKNPQKKIENRMTACQLASAGPVANPHQNQHQQNIQETLARKIYVGNVHSEVSGSKLLAFFSKYGEIEEGPLGFDKQTGKSKGFALFIYKTVEGARKALEEPNKNFEGHQLYCQKATDNHKMKAAVGGGPTNAPPGYNAAGGGVSFGMPDLGMNQHQSAALLGQGIFGGALPFGQGVPPNPAALAALAASGQNPAAFGVPQAVIASLSPALAALAATMNPGAAQPVVPSNLPQGYQSYGMGNQGYQSGQSHQVASSYPSGHMGQAAGPRPSTGSMGGYVQR